jgi:para-aminobenzoate synthetase component 1
MTKLNLQSWLLEHRQREPAVLLGAQGYPGGEQTFIASTPSSELRLKPGDVAALRRALNQKGSGRGAWVGYLSYEFALPFVHEPNLARSHAPWPAGFMRYYSDFNCLESSDVELPSGRAKPALGLRADDNDEVHAGRVEALKEQLIAGEVYEANLTRRFTADAVDPSELFLDLAEHAPAPYAVFFETPFGALVSNSPEAFLRLSAEGELSSFPIKGTRPRGHDGPTDERLRAELRVDEKELAEHLMVVDLMRNDLGRVCQAGSVNCGELFEVVPFPGLWHMVTRVSGQLSPRFDRADLLAMTLPAGSISGAPKRAAVKHIAHLEAGPRGPYCGIFIIAPDDGSLLANVLIRTAVCSPDQTVLQAGGGIVLGSQPERECQETWLKLRNFSG